MAIVTCRECRGQVSTEAATCPHCGVPNPAAHPYPQSQPPPDPQAGHTSAPPVQTASYANPTGSPAGEGRAAAPAAGSPGSLNATNQQGCLGLLALMTLLGAAASHVAAGVGIALVLAVPAVLAIIGKLPRSIVATLSKIDPAARGKVIGASVAELLFVVLIVQSTVSGQQQRDEDARRAIAATQRAHEEAARAAVEERRRLEALRASAAAAVGEVQLLLDSASELEGEEDLSGAVAAYEQVVASVSRFEDLDSPPVELGQMRELARERIAEIRPLVDARASLAQAQTLLQEGDDLAADRQWIEADAKYDAAAERLSTIPERLANELEVASVSSRLARRSDRIQDEVAEAEATALAVQLYRELCGPDPGAPGAWDGEYVGLRSHVRRAAHDPGSIDVESCSRARLTDENCWRTTCVVRGTNAFGALIANETTFWFRYDSGIAQVLATE